MISRREFLAMGSASVFYAGFPARGFAQTRDLGKIAVIILEGGMDGLAAVPAIGDPSLVKVRNGLISSSPIKINPFFGLHQNFVNFAEMLANNEAAIVHATSIPYINRSHFEGQNLMQSGGTNPFALPTGWLGRTLDLVGIPGKALALDMPLIIRGGSDLDNLFPANLHGTLDLKGGMMKALAASYDGDVAKAYTKLYERADSQTTEAKRREAPALAFKAGQEMAKPGGPNVSVIRLNEFDTHSNQGRDDGRLPRLFSTIDEIFKNYKDGLGAAWKDSIVLTLTEFGRTVREDGSEGTDHGYGTCGLLAGGLLKRASVLADWPGVGAKEMFQGRDLAATLDYRAVCAAAIEAAFRLPHDEIAERIFGAPKLAHVHDLLFKTNA